MIGCSCYNTDNATDDDEEEAVNDNEDNLESSTEMILFNLLVLIMIISACERRSLSMIKLQCYTKQYCFLGLRYYNKATHVCSCSLSLSLRNNQ
jgi:hypothetical protein